MPRAAITAVGHFLPEERLTNADLERLVDTNDEWIRTRTGITERRILRDKDKATSYMATRACREALDQRQVLKLLKRQVCQGHAGVDDVPELDLL
ncbi:MAG: hypothetical protein AAGN64_05775, partial [Bacteroidota bacterium]